MKTIVSTIIKKNNYNKRDLNRGVLKSSDLNSEDVSKIPVKKKDKKTKVLIQLFFSTLYISTFTFGGGFVIITFMKQKFVDKLHWIDEQEMLDLTALAQSSPGAIAVNAAIYHSFAFFPI